MIEFDVLKKTGISVCRRKWKKYINWF